MHNRLISWSAIKLGIGAKTNAYYAGWFDNTARDYSALLGREIRSEQLVLDAYLRETILAVKQTAPAKR